MTMTTVVPTFTPPAKLTAPAVVDWCHDCDLDLDEACLATQVRGSLDGEISVCDMHADWYDELFIDDLFGDDLNDEVVADISLASAGVGS